VKRRMGRDGHKWRIFKDLEVIGDGPIPSYCRGFRVERFNGYDNRKRTPTGLIDYYNNAE